MKDGYMVYGYMGIFLRNFLRMQNSSLLQTATGRIVSNPVSLPDLYFDSFSYPVASIVFGGMAIVLLFLLLFF